MTNVLQGNQANEVDEVIKDLKKNKGCHGYVIMNNDGRRAQGDLFPHVQQAS